MEGPSALRTLSPQRAPCGGSEGLEGPSLPSVPSPRCRGVCLTCPHLHAVGLVAHDRWAPHVAHGAGLRRLRDGWEALRGLGGHALRTERCDMAGPGGLMGTLWKESGPTPATW